MEILSKLEGVLTPDELSALRAKLQHAKRWEYLRPRIWASDLQDILDDYPPDTRFIPDIEERALRNDALIDHEIV